MKILSSAQIRELDQKTIAIQNISSWDLMERASLKATEYILSYVESSHISFNIFCGKGNNGGDGLAIARLLSGKKFNVKVFLLKAESYSIDNLQNQKLLKDLGIKISFFTIHDKIDIDNKSVIIDAIFGTGFNKKLDDDWQNIFLQIQKSKPYKIISIDLPSGFLSDFAMQENFPCIKADLVLTFEIPKLALLFPSSQNYLKDFTILTIDLDKDIREAYSSNYFYVDQLMVKNILKPISKFSHKGNFGHTLIIGGSYGKIGAPILSAKAALKTGSGLVSVYVPKCGYNIVQSTLIEVMCITDKAENDITEIPDLSLYNSVAIGMGIGQNTETENAILYCFKNIPNKNFVIDADALNILSKQKNPFAIIPKESILTPHPKELERLIGKWNNDFEKIEKVKEIAKQYQINIITKGAYTASVLSTGECYFNSTGNWGMATAGSGDTLSGILASLLGQGYSSHEACILGVYLHGLAGDLAIKNIHPHSLIASDISNYLSESYMFLGK